MRSFLDQLLQDVRYALRAMAANPLFSATAALSLALGIGANTTIYSFMDAILMRSLSVAEPGQLAIVEWHAPRRPPVVRMMINGSSHRYGKTGTSGPNFPSLHSRVRGAGYNGVTPRPNPPARIATSGAVSRA